MALYNPQYRLTVFAPASVDPNEVTVLTPAANAYHTSSFQVATLSGLSGYQPYLWFPTGRKGQYDPTSGKLTVGSLNFDLLDKRNTTTSNLQRWVTAFFGDINGKAIFSGLRTVVEESVDAGATWSPFFAGRISDAQLNDPLRYSLTIRDATDELNTNIFYMQPAYGTAGAALTSIVPMGLTAPYGPFPATSWLSGVVASGGTTTKTITLDAASVSNPLNQYNPVLDSMKAKASSVDIFGLHLLNIVTFNYDLAGSYRMFVSGGTLANAQYALNTVDVNNSNKVASFELSAISGSDPYSSPLTALTASQSYNIRMAAAYAAISSTNPLFISGQHPVSLFRDICQGKYGYINSGNGTPLKAMHIDVNAFANLIADKSFDTPRFKITTQYKIVDFFEKYLSSFGFGYRVEAQTSGSTIVEAIVPFDSRPPANLSSLPTITDTDLAAFDCSWQMGPVLSDITIKSYIEQPITPAANVSPFLIAETPFTTYELIPENANSNGTSLDIDALGIRTPDDSALIASYSSSIGTSVSSYNTAINRMLVYYNRFASGADTISLTCRRTTTVQSLKVGMWSLVQISMMPDPSSHLRGGTRLMQVIERSENGMNVTLKFMDSGKNTITVAPLVGNLSASVNYPTSGIVIPITTYSSSLRLEVDIATETIGASQPASGSADWDKPRFFTPPYQGVEYWEIDNLPAGKRFYVRVRASDISGNQPSAWVSASTPYIDLPIIAAPIGLTHSNLTNVSCDLSWSNAGDTGSQLIISIAAPSGTAPLLPVAQLMPGSSVFHLTGLTSSAAFQPLLVSVAHHDTAGGGSAAAFTSFTVTGSLLTCPNNPGRIAENTSGVTTYNNGIGSLPTSNTTTSPVQTFGVQQMGVAGQSGGSHASV